MKYLYFYNCMAQHKKIFVSVLMAILVFVCMLLPLAICAEEADASAQKPQVIKVGIYVINMGKLEVATGAFSIDFYLSLKSDQPVSETFEFFNGRAANIDKIIDKPNEKFYRILANLNSPIDFKHFPFDIQHLQLILEDKERNSKELVYVVNQKESGIDSSVYFPGWNMTGWKPMVADHNYPVYSESYSQYVFNVDIARVKMNSFIKTFLPVFFLMLTVISIFVLNPDQIITRLTTISSSLVASVMFHISIANQLPPVGYLTFADNFMLLTYFILLSGFFLNIGIFILQGRDQKELAKKFNRWVETLIFVGVPILYGLLFFLFKGRS